MIKIICDWCGGEVGNPYYALPPKEHLCRACYVKLLAQKKGRT